MYQHLLAAKIIQFLTEKLQFKFIEPKKGAQVSEDSDEDLLLNAVEEEKDIYQENEVDDTKTMESLNMQINYDEILNLLKTETPPIPPIPVT